MIGRSYTARGHLRAGELLTAGIPSNYRLELVMSHIHFTATIVGAGRAAEIAHGDGTPRVYSV